jgi:hypothetical protein
MIGRADAERAILEEVARCLEDRADLATWAEDLRAALALALDDAAVSRTEGWKAVTLRRHREGRMAGSRW